MSLLDDARRLAKIENAVAVDDGDAGHGKYGCCGEADYRGHLRDCPWLAMPRIVAALEAAEELLFYTIGWSLRCVFCSACTEHGDHNQSCPWQALVAALKDGDSA